MVIWIVFTTVDSTVDCNTHCTPHQVVSTVMCVGWSGAVEHLLEKHLSDREATHGVPDAAPEQVRDSAVDERGRVCERSQVLCAGRQREACAHLEPAQALAVAAVLTFAAATLNEPWPARALAEVRER